MPPAREQDTPSVLQEKLKTLKITAGQQSMPTAKWNTAGVPRELEEVSVKMEDASRRQRATDGVMSILRSRRLEAIRGRTDGQPPRNHICHEYSCLWAPLSK
jgi:hypothetical protein